MKILILTSAHPTDRKIWNLNFYEKRFPIGTGIIVQILRNAGHQVDFIDRYLLGQIPFDETHRPRETRCRPG